MGPALILLAFLAAGGIIARGGLPPRARAVLIVAAFAVGTALAVYLRRHPIFLQNAISVDEAQFLADAIQVASGRWVPWLDFDTGTVGFVIPYSLVPVVSLLPEAPYAGARILAVLCATGWTVGAYLALRTVLARSVALILAAPLLVIAALPGSGDLVTFSSELVPLGLALLGFGVALRATASASRTWVAAVGFVLIGLVPFAKLQIAPVALLYAVIALTAGGGIAILWRQPLRTATCLAAGLAPTFAIAVAALLSASFRTRLREVWQFTGAYTEQGNPLLDTLRFFFRGDAFFYLAIASGVAAVIALCLLALSARVRSDVGRRSLALAVLAGPLGVYTMALPGRGFPHYVWAGAVPALFGLLALFAVLLGFRTTARQLRLVVPAMLALAMLLLPASGSFRASAGIPPLQLTEDVWDPTPHYPPNDPPRWITGLGDTEQLAVREAVAACSGPIGVWGWDPQILVVTHRPYIGQSSVVPQQDIPAQSRWAGYMVEHRPECIVDATGPQRFSFTCGDGCALINQTFAGPVLEGYRPILELPNYRVYRRD